MYWARLGQVTAWLFLAFAAPAVAEPLKIGVAGPMSGPLGSYGLQMRDGAAQAALDINAAGGIRGHMIELQSVDDYALPDKAYAKARALVEGGVRFVVGNFNNAPTIAAAQVYADGGALFITPTAGQPEITNGGHWNAFRLAGRDDELGRLWSNYALAHLSGKKIAVLYEDSRYGRLVGESARDWMKKSGLSAALSDEVHEGQTDFSSLASAVQQKGVEYVMWGGSGVAGAQLLRQMHSQGLKTIMLTGSGAAGPDFVGVAGEAAVGTLVWAPMDSPSNARAKDVILRLKQRGIDASGGTLYSYAAMEIFKQAAERAQTDDPKKIAEYMHSGAVFSTIVGDISFDTGGDRKTFGNVMHVLAKRGDGAIALTCQNGDCDVTGPLCSADCRKKCCKGECRESCD